MTKSNTTPGQREFKPVSPTVQAHVSQADGMLYLAIPMPKNAAAVAALAWSKGKPGEVHGKNKIVASTGGFVVVPGTDPAIRIGVNAITAPLTAE